MIRVKLIYKMWRIDRLQRRERLARLNNLTDPTFLDRAAGQVPHYRYYPTAGSMQTERPKIDIVLPGTI